MFLGAALIGMGEMCAQLSAIALIGKEAPVRGRGAVIGLFSFFGALGIMGSGYFRRHGCSTTGRDYGPFVLVGCGNIVVFYAGGAPAATRSPSAARNRPGITGVS